MDSNIVLKDNYFDFPIAGSPPKNKNGNGRTNLTVRILLNPFMKIILKHLIFDYIMNNFEVEKKYNEAIIRIISAVIR